MDTLLAAYRHARASSPDPRAARQSFQTALREGRLDEARSALDAWAKTEERSLRAQAGLKIDVLALLSDEQLTKLRALRPNPIALVWEPRPAWGGRASERKSPPPS